MNNEIEQNSELLNSVQVFMEKANQLPVSFVVDQDERWEAQAVRRLRRKMIREEIKEYFDAEDESDLVETIDGLLDIIVVAWGSILTYVGPQAAHRAANEVAKSNLAKVIGEGLPIFRNDGKVLKPEGWQPPNIRKTLGVI